MLLSHLGLCTAKFSITFMSDLSFYLGCMVGTALMAILFYPPIPLPCNFALPCRSAFGLSHVAGLANNMLADLAQAEA